MKFIRLLIIILAGIIFPLIAQADKKTFDFNASCQQAYQAIMAMKTDKGRQMLDHEKQAHPDNLIPYFLDNYIDLLQLFFTENADDYTRQSKYRTVRLNLMNEGDPSSPFYLYTKAVLHFQWSMIKIKFGERWSAVWEFRKAYLLLKENEKKFPNFTPNDIYLGAMESVIGTIPSGYKWISNMLGMSGSVSKGMSKLQSYINDNGPYSSLFKEEAYLYYCYLEFYIQNKPEEVFRFIKEKNLDIKSNQLFAFMATNLAINHQMGAYARKVMDERDKGPQYAYLPAMDYEMGMIYLDHLELDSAIYFLQRFVNNFKGNFYIKDVLHKLSWAYYLKGNMQQANSYKELIKKKGNTETDADKAALREAQKSGWPNPDLLRPRLLSDGGYLEEALQLLNQKKVTDFSSVEDKIEFAYRLGRIYDEMGQQDKAIPFYEATIKGGSELPEYFAARAAWQMGLIYEKRGDKAKAINYYNQCLNMHESEYKNSLDQRAKAGINRLSGK